MKLKLILFISLFITFKSFSQAYQPFNLGSAVWIYDQYNMNNTHTQYYYTSLDTNGIYINGHKYYNITGINNLTNLFDDTLNRKVYQLVNGSDEELLYDFSVNVGDTLKGILCFQSLRDTVRIDSVKYISYNSIIRKTIYLKAWSSNGSGNRNIWIEGIGSPIELRYSTQIPTDPIWHIQCNQSNGYQNYGNVFSCAPVSVINENNNTNLISILPNPSETGIFKINTSEKITWKIVNLNGKIISEGNQNDINISKEASGIYILQIMAADKIQIIKLQKL